jgi:hypothetical protein
VKLSLSGSLYRLRARRRLEQATPRHGEVMGLLKKLRPAHKTIADCRTHNLTPLRQVCRTLTLLGKQLDLFGAELVAIDGSPCRAVNAQERPGTQAKRTQLLAPIDERVAASLKELARRDDQEDRGTGGGPQPTPWRPRSRRSSSGSCSLRAARHRAFPPARHTSR